MSGTVPTQLGLRREDFTDIPPPSREDVGNRFFTPIANQPNDAIVERAQDVAGMAGGTMFGIKPGVGSLGSGPLMKMGEMGKKMAKDLDGNELTDYHGQPIETGPDGKLTLYHRTNEPAREEIYKTGKFTSKENTNETFFSDNLESEYGKGFGDHVVAVKIDPKYVRLNDQFPSGENHYAVSNKYLSKGNLLLPVDHDPFVTDVYHGTKKAGFDQFNVPDPVKEFMPDRALGVHVSKDPEIANTFTMDVPGNRGIEGAAVYPLKIPDESKFFEVKQDLHPYIEDRNTPKNNRNVGSDQNAIEEAIFKTAYKKEPELLANYLMQARAVPKEDAYKLAADMANGKKVDLPVDGPGWDLDRFIRNFGGKPYNAEDRARGVAIFKKEMQDKGYVGLKYINTSPMETANAKDFTSYIVFDPRKHIQSKYVKSLMSDTGTPGAPLAALASQAKAPTFYSAVEHAVNNIPQAKMPAEQWLGTLSNKPGVKPEELDWIGLKDFLADKKGQTVTKQEVQDFVNANKVELKEVNKGQNDIPKIEVVSDKTEDGTHNLKMKSNSGRIYEADKDEGSGHYDVLEMDKDKPGTVAANLNVYAGGRPETLEEIKNMIIAHEKGENFHSGIIAGTKYHSYQLPGGENYREMLLTLPEEKVFRSHNGAEFTQAEMNDPIVRRLNEKIGGQWVEPTNYQSSHWDEPNVLAHVRMNDRTIDGKKSLHIEEIQSDWHQQGRDKGYKEEIPLPSPRNWVNFLAEKGYSREEALALWNKRSSPEDVALHNEHLRETEDRTEAMARRVNAVPDAPFKKSWHELALKRMIREAAEKGYDRLSWTPGEAQAARYDLSKHVDRIAYNKDEHTLQTFDKKGEISYNKRTTPEELPNVIGKEATDRLLNNPSNTKKDRYGNWNMLEGLDLKIGGEGMKGFYDQIIPKAVEKIGKEHGVKVKQGEIPLGGIKQDGISHYWYHPDMKGSWKTKAEAEKALKQKIHYIDIPQSLKDTATKKGFPLFSSGIMFVPVDHDPWASDNGDNSK
jgi:hypothetical protein